MVRFTASWSGKLGRLRNDEPDLPVRVYLDYGGFAPVDPRVLAMMRPFLEGGVGNPSALHSLGSEAKESLEAARVKVARLLGGTASGVIFTSGATEANNLAIKGVALRAAPAGGHVIISAVEHISVLNPCRDLEKQGFSVTSLPVDGDGRADPDALARAIRPETVLVSIQAANPEVGTVQPIAALARAAGDNVAFHVDAVGAAGRIPLLVDELGIDLLTLSGNDLYGPPGSGALWVRPGVRLVPQILGGGQEGGYRSGTENLPAIVGMGVAAELARLEGPAEALRLARLRDRMIDGLLAEAECRLTGSRTERLPHHVSVCLRAVKADSVLMDLDLSGVAASSGSACASKTLEPSQVLRAIGCDAEEAEGSLCFTLGRWTAAAEIEAVLTLLARIVRRLRALAPLRPFG